jgi:hypothetical protein
MAASSVTGTGPGASNKVTTKQLAVLANGPTILIAGTVEAAEVVSSPPTNGGTITFPEVLAGSSDDYVVLLTTQNGGSAYVSAMHEVSGNFSGFTYVTEEECTAMYMVTKCGYKAKI